jgi:hypothetical protein
LVLVSRCEGLQAGDRGGGLDGPGPGRGDAQPEPAAAADQAGGGGEQAQPQALGFPPAAGAGDAVTALLARDPAAHVRLDDPQAFASLLWELNAAGASDAVTTRGRPATCLGLPVPKPRPGTDGKPVWDASTCSP